MIYLLLIFSGFMLGVKHALEPDHVAALSTIVREGPSLRKSSLSGALWGVGHTLVLFLVGFFVLVLRINIPEKASLTFELLVGLVLIALGGNLIAKLIQGKIHIHTHRHEEVTHTHFHSHERAASHAHPHKPFLLGALHGLSGSGALVLLVLASVQSIPWGLLFILVFGLGSIIGMLLTSAAISLPFLIFQNSSLGTRLINWSAAILSIFIGTSLVFEISKKLLA